MAARSGFRPRGTPLRSSRARRVRSVRRMAKRRGPGHPPSRAAASPRDPDRLARRSVLHRAQRICGGPRSSLAWLSVGGVAGRHLVTAYLWALLTPAVMRTARILRPRRGTRGRESRCCSWRVGGRARPPARDQRFYGTRSIRVRRRFAAMFFATLAFGGAARLGAFCGIVGVTWGIDDYATYREEGASGLGARARASQTQLEALSSDSIPRSCSTPLSTICR